MAKILVALCAGGGLSCSHDDIPPHQEFQEPRVPLREVRVLVASDAARVRLRFSGTVSVLDDSSRTLASMSATHWVVAAASGPSGMAVGERTFSAAGITLVPPDGATVLLSVPANDGWSRGRPYPGSLRIVVLDAQRLNVINLVDVETYVACVVACEVWPTFESEAYRAQAVATRTYVLYEMLHRQRADWDVVATQNSQVYQGVRSDAPGRRAAGATRVTRGLVSTCCGEEGAALFPTYYSSVCGGTSQAASIFGPQNEIEALAGGVRCEHCSIAPSGTYRWGPVRISMEEVRSKLVQRYPELDALGQIAAVSATEVQEADGAPRIITVRIAGTEGRTHDMLAEQFRLALGPMQVKSTACRMRTEGDELVFEDGRGFGHGLGLCQWGMQAQALAGKGAGEILRYYYPGSRLTRVY